MKEILNDLYNKVLGFFQSEKGENTKVTATNRLKLVLLHDRTNLDTVTMQKMREQLINVISRYIEIDQEALDLNLEGEGDSIALMLNIPVVRARTKEEIEELEIAAEEAKKAEILASIEEQPLESDENEEETEDAEEEDKEETNETSSETEEPNEEQQKIDFEVQDDGEAETAQESEEQSPSEETNTEPVSKKKRANKK